MSILFKSVDGALDIGRAWLAVGSPAPTALVNARLQQHWAVQVVSAVAHTHAKPLPDDSHTACQWQGATGMMRGQPVGGGARLRAALAPGPLALRLIGEREGAVVDELSLPGRTLDEAYDWMAERLAVHSDGRISGPLGRRDYDMPDHPVANGAPFADRDPHASAELARWFHDANRVFTRVGAFRPEAGPTYIWPHHFDIATLIPVPGGATDEPRSIGVGLSGGDQSYSEPYWYVTPWPTPPDRKLPQLAGHGQWHVEGWVGAVLLGTTCVLAGRGRAQAARTAAFLESAISAATRLVTNT